METQTQRKQWQTWARDNRAASTIIALLTVLLLVLFFALWQGRAASVEAALQNVRLTKQVATLQSRVDELNGQMEQVRKEAARAREESVSRLNEVAELQTERDALKEKVQALEKRVATLKAETARLKSAALRKRSPPSRKMITARHRQRIRKGCGAWKCYVVRRGDTPAAIAARVYHGAKHSRSRWVALLEANGIPATPENARKLPVGKQLLIPHPQVAAHLTKTWQKRQLARKDSAVRTGAVDGGEAALITASLTQARPAFESFASPSSVVHDDQSDGWATLSTASLHDDTSPRRTAGESQSRATEIDILASLPGAVHRWYGGEDGRGKGEYRRGRGKLSFVNVTDSRLGHDPP